ncbi:hypothetical protein [Clostridium cellulovorans]|uniref:hypothetical protein n=1 Tax=Clostridium cellulovorans TaxID=1493 RepID=UPI0001E8EEB7|nr:hypothetical protein [Clostridium cellulovorans]
MSKYIKAIFLFSVAVVLIFILKTFLTIDLAIISSLIIVGLVGSKFINTGKKI